MVTETQRLQKWMTEHGYSAWDMAKELGVSRVWVYRTVKYNDEISDGLKLRFINRFGIDIASQVFDLPAVPAQ